MSSAVPRFIGAVIAIVLLLILAGAAVWLLLAVWGGVIDSIRTV